MKAVCLSLSIFLSSVCECVSADKLTLAHDEGLRAELEQTGGSKSYAPAYFVNTTFLDEFRRMVLRTNCTSKKITRR